MSLRKLWDGVANLHIDTVEKRKEVARQIRADLERGDAVKCFRDYWPYIWVCNRRPRLEDYFKSWGASREKVVV